MLSEIQWSVRSGGFKDQDYIIQARIERCRIQRLLTTFEQTRIRFPGFIFYVGMQMQKVLLIEVFVSGRKR